MTAVIADSVTLADAFIKGVLTADDEMTGEAPGGVLIEETVQGERRNVVRVTYQHGATAQGAGAFRGMEIINNDLIYEVLTYLVRMSGYDNTFADLSAGATRIKQLLHKSDGDIMDGDTLIGRCLWCKYLTPWRELLPDPDVLLPELGGFYEIAVKPV